LTGPRRPPAAPSRIPDSVAHLDVAVVAETLVRHGANVRSAAAELGVPTSDLRQLTLVKQALINAAYEAEELRLDQAEAVVDEALKSDDSRRTDAAAYFILRNSSRAKRRGWITSSSASVDMNIQTNTGYRKAQGTIELSKATMSNIDCQKRQQREQHDRNPSKLHRHVEASTVAHHLAWQSLSLVRAASRE